MRRAIARGRLVPQSRSTDPRMGRVSLKAATLYDRMWINGDDQGRLSGDPDEIKYTACPNLPDISKDDIPDLLKELEAQGLIKAYTTSKTKAIQMLDWWEEQRLQWAWPSPFSPPEGWQDRLRYKKSAKEVVTENWGSPENPPESSPETSAPGFLTTSSEKEKERGKRRGRGISPERSGERAPPSPSTHIQIYGNFVECYEQGWGKKTDGKTLAQMRDFSQELSAAGCPESYVREAFKEAAEANKYKLTYVRAILLDWLGVERNRSP